MEGTSPQKSEAQMTVSSRKIQRHICWVHGLYQVVTLGRKWWHCEHASPNCKPYRDRIIINQISTHWQIGSVVEVWAILLDDQVTFGSRLCHRVSLIPVTREEFNVAPVRYSFIDPATLTPFLAFGLEQGPP